jgi:hypothetical protein
MNGTANPADGRRWTQTTMRIEKHHHGRTRMGPARLAPQPRGFAARERRDRKEANLVRCGLCVPSRQIPSQEDKAVWDSRTLSHECWPASLLPRLECSKPGTCCDQVKFQACSFPGFEDSTERGAREGRWRRPPRVRNRRTLVGLRRASLETSRTRSPLGGGCWEAVPRSCKFAPAQRVPASSSGQRSRTASRGCPFRVWRSFGGAVPRAVPAATMGSGLRPVAPRAFRCPPGATANPGQRDIPARRGERGMQGGSKHREPKDDSRSEAHPAGLDQGRCVHVRSSAVTSTAGTRIRVRPCPFAVGFEPATPLTAAARLPARSP